MKEKITIIGTGAYGTAMANVLADNEHNVIMYGIKSDEINDVNLNHMNSRYFKETLLNDKIKATDDFYKATEESEYLILAVPVVAIKDILETINTKIKKSITIINVSKGLDPETYDVLSKTIKKSIKPEILKEYVGIYGPSIAKEVIEKKVTCVTYVCKDINVAKKVSIMFSNNYFLVSPDTDVVGAECGVALKNVVAICSGMLNDYSDSTRSSLITIGFDEIIKFGQSIGANVKTFYNFAEIGDLILTATSSKSRNYELGQKIARLGNAKLAIESFDKTVEGVLTCKTAYLRIQETNLDLPLFKTVYSIIHKNESPNKIMDVFSKSFR